MARTVPRVANAAVTLTSMVASARQVSAKTDSDALRTSGERGWQSQAWRFYDQVGEFRAAVNWVGNVLSRARLYATYDDGTGPRRVEQGTPADLALDEFGGGVDGQRQLLHDYGVMYSVPGEAWTVGYEKNHQQVWAVYSPGQITSQGGDYLVGNKKIPTKAVVIQSLRPHPRDRSKPDSPARAALPALAEIHRLNQHIAAQLDSRLASAGILLVPNEIAATVAGAASPSTQATAQAFVDHLQEVMGRAIADRDDPAALVPIVVTGEAEHLEAARLLKFWSDLDEKAITMRTEAVRRLGLSLDMPPEILTGTGDINHWGAWQIDESAIKSHTEPLLSLICHDLSVGYLRPALAGTVPDSEVQRYGIEADTSEMRLRPNRSKEALELYDRGELDGDTLRTETGFTDNHGLDKKEELQQWVLLQMIRGNTSANPEQVAWALSKLGFSGVPTEGDERGPRETPSLEDHPRNDPPEAALLACAEQMVYRALERAGNRLRNRQRACPEGVAAAETYLFATLEPGDVEHALADAWTHVERFAGTFGVEPVKFAAVLDAYCRDLVTSRKPYDRRTLADRLTVLR